MAFWHMAFLAGTAALAIPVAIHLMFKLRRRRLVFSSLRFLQQSVLRQSRRLRLRELLLLLLRCAACVLIALAFARPYRPGTAAAAASGALPEDLVLVLDDSPSLLAQEGAGLRWNSLLEKARKAVSSRPGGGRAGLVLASEPARPEVELSGNFGAVLAALQRERPSAIRGDLSQALNTALELLAASAQANRRVLVLSDFQSNQIERGAWAEAAQKAAAAGRGIAVQLEGPGDGQPARLANLAVTQVNARSDVWIEGQPVPFAVRVANFSDAEKPNVAVKLTVDGKVLAARTVALGPRAATEFEMSAVLPHAGDVAGRAGIDAADVLPDDDTRYFAVHLRDSLKVLLIEDHLNERDVFLDEGYYVRMALDPRPRGVEADANAGARNYIRVQPVEAAKLTPRLCAQSDLLVLAGISALTGEELAMIEDAVRAGHNLILFTGRSDGRLAETFYNGPFWKNGLGLLPVRPGTLYTGNRLERRYHQLGEFKQDHPLFKPFVGENEPSLRLATYLRHYEANPADAKLGSDPASPGAPTRPAGEVLASFSDGSPFAVERPFGKGMVLMFTFAPRPEATDLPKHKAFVPLLHQAVRYLARVTNASRRTLITGEQFDFAEAGVLPDSAVSLELPGKHKERLNLLGSDHPAADAPGIYTLTFSKGDLQEKALWAVNLDPRESALNSEDLGALRAVFASNSTDKPANPAASDPRWEDERKAQAPDWRYFLAAALVCLLMEVWLRDFWN